MQHDRKTLELRSVAFFVGLFLFFAIFLSGISRICAQSEQPNRSSSLFPVVGPQMPQEPGARTTDTQKDVATLSNPTRKAKPPFAVFVPVDENDQEKDDFVYLSLDMLNELKKINGTVVPSMNRWYIRSAKYQGFFSLNRHPLSTGMSVANLKATFEIELETENAMLVFPEMPLMPDGARWDGQPISFRHVDSTGTEQPATPRTSTAPAAPGAATQKRLLFNIEQQSLGTHTLEVQLNVAVEKIDETQRRLFIGSLPKIADAVLELSLEPDAPVVTIQEARGHILNEPGKMIAKLGPVDRFTLSWNETGRLFGQPVVECDQMFLLIARTNQVEVIARHRFRISGGKVSELEIAADPRMQLGVTPPTCIASSEPVNLVRVDRSSTSSGVMPLKFEKPISGTVTIQANYLLRNFTGIGVVRFPRIQPTKTRITRSWLGICTEPGLEIENPHVSTLTQDRFLQEWSDKPREPLIFVYDLAETDPSWTFSVRTKPPLSRAKSHQSLLLRLNRSESILRATLETEGQVFRHALLVPEHFEIERIELNTLDGEERTSAPVRWAFQSMLLNPKNALDAAMPIRYRILSVFSERPLSGTYEILVRGRQPGAAGERTLPLLVLDGIELSENRLDLFHDLSIVQESRRVPKSWIPVQNLLDMRSPDWNDAIFTGAWTLPLSPEAASPGPPSAPKDETKTLSEPLSLSQPEIKPAMFSSNDAKTAIPETAGCSVLPNAPQVAGTMVTKINRLMNQDRFHLHAIFDLEITQGELHSIRLAYDDVSLFLPTCEASLNPVLKMEGEKRFLLLNPTKPLRGKVRFSFETVLNSPNENLTLPKIVPEPAWGIKHYLVLPVEMHQRAIEWEKKQLALVDSLEAERILAEVSPKVPEPSEDELAGVTHASAVDRFEVYLINGKDYFARINPKGNRPTVPLHDASFYLRKSGSLSGVSTFELRGEGTDHCVLVLPPPYELVSVTVGGITSVGTPLSPGRWRIDIWPDPLPQRIVVVYHGNLVSETFAENGSSDFFPPEIQKAIAGAEKNEKTGTEETAPEARENSTDRYSSPQSSTSRNAARPRTAFSLYTANDLQRIKVPLPFLESTDVQGTIWTFAFETPDERHPLRFFVAPMKSEHANAKPVSTPLRSPEFELRFQDEEGIVRDDSTYADFDYGTKKETQEPILEMQLLRKRLEERSAQPLMLKAAIPGVIQMNLVRLYSLESMMTHTTNSTSGTSPENLARWYSNWGRRWWRIKHETDSLMSMRDIDNKSLWKSALFGDEDFPDSLSDILNSTQPPDRIGNLRMGTHETTIQSMNLQYEDRNLSDADYSESNLFSAFRMSQSEQSAYLFGANGGEILELQLYAVPKTQGILDEPTIRWSVMALLGLGILILARSFHLSRVFRQYPFFLGHAAAILLWLIFPPGFIGLALIPFLWLAMFWSSWGRKRGALE